MHAAGKLGFLRLGGVSLADQCSPAPCCCCCCYGLHARVVQVFSQPVFHGLEMAVTDHVPGASRAPTLVLRIVLRSLYVCFTTTVAVLMPFFTDIIGLVGALVFWPAAVYYPVKLYCKLYKPRRSVLVLMQIMNVVAAVTSLLAVIGASWNIKQHVSHFTFSWLQQGQGHG